MENAQMRSRLQAVGEPEQVDEAEAAAVAATSPQSRVAQAAIAAGLMLALRTLSQRALVALAAVEHLLLAGTVFALWLSVIAQPTTLQLVSLGMYGVFVLALIALRRR
jgi:glucose-6-phosphate dehydrogenase assembly protein OpcA